MRVNEQLIAGGRLDAGWGGENARRWGGGYNDEALNNSDR